MSRLGNVVTTITLGILDVVLDVATDIVNALATGTNDEGAHA